VNPETANIELRQPAGDALLKSAQRLAEQTISRLLPGTVIFSGRNADKQKVWEGIAGYDVVHIGAHAEIADAPFITLAPGKELGRLTPCEISRQPDLVVRAQLIVLAACQSAVAAADFRKDTRLASLAYAFASIGVPNVVGTLWEVAADATSEELMTAFYGQLAEQRGAVASSLAEAQRTLARSGARYAHPYYWAGFVVMTADRGLKL